MQFFLNLELIITRYTLYFFPLLCLFLILNSIFYLFYSCSGFTQIFLQKSTTIIHLTLSKTSQKSRCNKQFFMSKKNSHNSKSRYISFQHQFYSVLSIKTASKIQILVESLDINSLARIISY
jgi:hypothetical protein